MPMEANARIVPVRISREVGYWFTNKDVPNSWIGGVIAGHEFKKKTEVDLELYDQDATRAAAAGPKTRESTLGIGFHPPLGKKGPAWSLLIRAMSKTVQTMEKKTERMVPEKKQQDGDPNNP